MLTMPVIFSSCGSGLDSNPLWGVFYVPFQHPTVGVQYEQDVEAPLHQRSPDWVEAP